METHYQEWTYILLSHLEVCLLTKKKLIVRVITLSLSLFFVNVVNLFMCLLYTQHFVFFWCFRRMLSGISIGGSARVAIKFLLESTWVAIDFIESIAFTTLLNPPQTSYSSNFYFTKFKHKGYWVDCCMVRYLLCL